MRSTRSKKMFDMVKNQGTNVNNLTASQPYKITNVPKMNDDIDSTVKFKMGKFFESQNIKINDNTDSPLKTYSNLTPVPTTHEIEELNTSDVSINDDSGSSYKPNECIDKSSSESKSSIYSYNSILLMSPVKLDNPIIEEKPVSEYTQLNSKINLKSKNYNLLATVEVSKKTGLPSKRLWDKKDLCIFCEEQVTNLSRHMQRKHNEEIEVARFLACKKGSKERKNLIEQLRKRGNFFSNLNDVPKIKPVRRPNECVEQPQATDYLPCKFCFGLYKKKYLRRHIKICSLKKDSVGGQRRNVQAEAQSLLIAFENEDTKLVEQVFPRMVPDNISLVVKNDPLIRAFGTRYLKCHKEKHLITVVSNKMRELGRLLIAMRQYGDKSQTLIDCLKPEFFDNIIKSTKEISGYDHKTDKFKAPSLVLKIGTSLKQCCDIAEYMLLKKSQLLCVNEETDMSITKVKTVENLIQKQWSYELSTNASKELYQKKWNRPALLPLTSDIKMFRDHLLSVQKNALIKLKINPSDIVAFKSLQETVLAQLILLNRKRAGEVQRIFLKTYLNCSIEAPQEEVLSSLSAVENELTKKFKRIVIRGKRGRGVPVLFTPKLQKTLSLLISVRETVCDKNNEYLFAIPNTKDSCLRASEVIRKLALASGVKNPSTITSTKLRKQVATVAQLLNFTEGDVEQLANFMGHSKEVHKTYYRLPENIFQVAKVSKFLLMMEKGDADQYRGKNIDDIDVNGLVSDESDSQDTDISCSDDEPENQEFSEINEHDQTYKEQNNTVSEVIPEVVRQTPKELNPTSLRKKKKIIPSAENSKISSKRNSKVVTKSKFVRITWTDEQKAITTSFFQKHILLKKPPKKEECEDFLSKNKLLMSGFPWRKVKTFVYNYYKDV